MRRHRFAFYLDIRTDFACVELDHLARRRLKIPGFVRYCVDMFCFGDRRADLRAWRAAIAEWLHTAHGLRLKPPNARVLGCGGRLDALGYRITRDERAPRRRAMRRLRRRVVYGIDGRSSVDLGRSVAVSAGVVLFDRKMAISDRKCPGVANRPGMSRV